MCVSVCDHMYKLDRVKKLKDTASFCGIYLCLQYCRNGLRPVFVLSAIFRVYLFFLKLSGLAREVDRK